MRENKGNYMHLLVGFCLLTVVSCRAVHSRTRMLSVKLDHADNEMTVREQFTNGRIKRGVFGIIGKLLQSAKHVDSYTNYRLYIKTGGYKKALSDFEKLNPTALRIYPEARWGIVGGSIVRVQRGPANTAEMSILRPDIDSIDQYDFILNKIKYNN